jgi:hypothetical protein
MMEWIQEHQNLATLVFTGVVAIATVVYAVLTWQLVSETRRMRRAQTEPRVAVFFEPLEHLVMFGHLRVRNIGLGPAYDVRFRIRSEGSTTGGEMLIADFCKTKFLERGMGYLGPGQELVSGFTRFPDGYEEKIKAILRVEVTYKSSVSTWHSDEYRVDFSEIEGTARLGNPPLHSIAKVLESIQKDVHRVASGFQRVKVDVFDNDDRASEAAQIQKVIEEEESATDASTTASRVSDT